MLEPRVFFKQVPPRYVGAYPSVTITYRAGDEGTRDALALKIEELLEKYPAQKEPL